jgi:hypothetical protein
LIPALLHGLPFRAGVIQVERCAITPFHSI